MVIDENIVVNRVSSETTFDEIESYLRQNIESWREFHLLWDMSEFNFDQVDINSHRSFALRSAGLAEARQGRKTAFIVKDDLGFGKMRQFQGVSSDKAHIDSCIFRDEASAREWLGPEKDE